MNEIRVACERHPGILRAIDEIAFHTSILALNAAVEAACGHRVQPAGAGQAAVETLALIEESIARYRAALFPDPRRPSAAENPREGLTEAEAHEGTAERVRRMKCASPVPAMAPAAVRKMPRYDNPR